jgi:hypothetical protein
MAALDVRWIGEYAQDAATTFARRPTVAQNVGGSRKIRNEFHTDPRPKIQTSVLLTNTELFSCLGVCAPVNSTLRLSSLKIEYQQ